MSALIRAIPCSTPERTKDPRRVLNGYRGNAAKKASRFPHVANPWGLTGAEFVCLAKLLEGSTPLEAAREMCISHKTHQSHVCRARQKMNAGSTLHACLLLDRWMRGTKPQDFEVVVRIVNGQPSTSVREITNTEAT